MICYLARYHLLFQKLLSNVFEIFILHYFNSLKTHFFTMFIVIIFYLIVLMTTCVLNCSLQKEHFLEYFDLKSQILD